MTNQSKKANRKTISEVNVSTQPSELSFQLGTYQWQLLIILLFSCVLYINTLGADYTLDDAIVINQNKFTKEGLSGIKDIFSKDTFYGFFGEKKDLVSGGRYRPLSVATFAIEHAFFKESPAISHLINMLIYAGLCMLLFVLLRKWFPGSNDGKEVQWFTLPFIATLLFIAHPIHTEVVANIKGRDELMCLLGALAMLYGSFLYVRNGNNMYLLLSCICFFLALLSKENAITFLAILPVSLLFYNTEDKKRIITITGCMIAVAAVYLLIRRLVIGPGASITGEVTEVLNNPFVYMSTMQKYATIIYTWGRYIALLLVPYQLSHDYYFNQIPAQSFSSPVVILVISAILISTYYLIKGWREKSIWSFSILFYFATFSVVSNIFFPVGTTMSERFVFISSIPFCLLLAYVLLMLYKKMGKNLFLGSIIVIIGLYSVKTIGRNFVWHDNYTLFSTDVKASPNSAKLRNAMGGESLAQADKEQDAAKKQELIKQAIENLQEAVRIYPKYNQAWLLMGNAYFQQNLNYDEAIKCYQKCVEISPGFTDGYYNLAQMYKGKGDKRTSINFYLKLLSYKQDHVQSYYEIGMLLKELGKPDSALAFLNKVTELNPNYNGVYSMMGTIYGQQKGDMNNAIVYLTKALEQNPNDASASENLGIAYAILKDFNHSTQYFEKAIQLSPNNTGIYRNLGISYMQLGKKAEAQRCFAKADSIEGKHP